MAHWNPTMVSATVADPFAHPEHMALLLLEGGQRFLVRAQEALQRGDAIIAHHYQRRLLTVLHELDRSLDHRTGGDLVETLSGLYAWWGEEVVRACDAGDPRTLGLVFEQMGEVRHGWEQAVYRAAS